MPVSETISWVRVQGANQLVRVSAISEVQINQASGDVFVRTPGGDWLLVHEIKEGMLEFQKLFEALDLRNSI